MEISTNCSPLVILWVFFQTKQSHSAREGAGRVGELSWGFFFCLFNKRRCSRRSLILLPLSGGRWGGGGIYFYYYCYYYYYLGGVLPPLRLYSDVDLFAEALSRSIGPPETAFESAHCEIHSGNLDKILTVY